MDTDAMVSLTAAAAVLHSYHRRASCGYMSRSASICPSAASLAAPAPAAGVGLWAGAWLEPGWSLQAAIIAETETHAMDLSRQTLRQGNEYRRVMWPMESISAGVVALFLCLYLTWLALHKPDRATVAAAAAAADAAAAPC